MTAFQRQIEVAKKYDLPVNVHSRYAGHYCIDLLIQQGVKKALLHAYDGSKKSVKKGLAAGFYFSIPAAVKESTTFQRLAQTARENAAGDRFSSARTRRETEFCVKYILALKRSCYHSSVEFAHPSSRNCVSMMNILFVQ